MARAPVFSLDFSSSPPSLLQKNGTPQRLDETWRVPPVSPRRGPYVFVLLRRLPQLAGYPRLVDYVLHFKSSLRLGLIRPNLSFVPFLPLAADLSTDLNLPQTLGHSHFGFGSASRSALRAS